MSLQQYVLPRRQKADLAFEGKILGTATTHAQHRPRWVVLTLYETKGGAYVLAEERHQEPYNPPAQSGEPDIPGYVSRDAKVYSSLAELLANQVMSPVLKALLRASGLKDETIERIE